VEHNAFFLQRSHQSILLTEGVPQSSLRQLHWIDVTQAEEALVRDLLRLHQHAHRNGYPVELPKMTDTHSSSSRVSRDELTTREIDVLRSIVRGRLNKQIADELHIALTTVISHRRNLIAKLGIRSVSALTIYAVTKGYVDAEQLADER
jgi:DNA-binding NarL/FixJ family response regulator